MYITPQGKVATCLDKATYMAVSAAFTPPATPNDVFTITGSASKTVRVLRLGISTTQGTAGINTWFMIARSAANTGGTSTNPTAVPLDRRFSAATATINQYSANPTTGTAVGTIWTGWVDSPVVTTAGVGLLVNEVNFMDALGSPMTLVGVNDALALNFGGAALPAGLSVLCYVQWTEE